MKTVEEILSYKGIYSDKLKIGNDGIKGFISVNRIDMSFVASWGGGWDHVSVAPIKRYIVPDWNTMCKVKQIFFKPDETAIEIHPAEDQYVDNLSNCLHLWRANDKEMVLPPSFMVGIRVGQTRSELQAEIDKYYKENGYEQ
jgi:hypothetical protein